MSRPNWYCSHCGTIAPPKRYVPGSFVMELCLYVLMILPGVVYTTWRLMSKYWGCPACGAPNMLPLESPKAQEALAARRDTSETVLPQA